MGFWAAVPAFAGLLEKAIGLFEGDDKEQMQLFKTELETAHKERLAQLEVNKNEAAHRSLFVAGWRPGLMWLCIIACGIDWLIRPFLPYFGMDLIPPITGDHMFEIMFGVLGLGGLRTFEKSKAITK